MQEVLAHSRKVIIFLFFITLSVCLITFQLRILDNVILLVFSPLQKVMISAIDKVQDKMYRLYTFAYLLDDYESLRAENIELKTRILTLNESQAQVDRLQQLLLLQDIIPYRTVAAKVIGKSPVESYSSLIIDQGRRRGIRKFQGVINSSGIIGRIIYTSAFSSKVQVIVDSDCSIAALNQRTRDNGLVRGCGYREQLLKMDFVYYRAQFQVGDLIITSGLDQVFPKGLPIGTVYRIEERNDGLFYQSIEIIPVVDLSRIEEVLVVLHN